MTSSPSVRSYSQCIASVILSRERNRLTKFRKNRSFARTINQVAFFGRPIESFVNITSMSRDYGNEKALYHRSPRASYCEHNNYDIALTSCAMSNRRVATKRPLSQISLYGGGRAKQDEEK